MPFARSHLLVTFLGDAWSQKEEWQFGLRFDSDTLPGTPVLQAMSDAYASLHSNASPGHISSSARFIGVKAAVIGPDGRYPTGAESVELLRTPLAGGGTDTAPQLSVAITLTTALPRGRGSKGRFYLPPPSRVLLPAADGLLNASDASTFMARVVTFLDACNGAGAGALTVFSELGPANPVTGLRVGRVVDTQRRRRNQISEEYLVSPLA